MKKMYYLHELSWFKVIHSNLKSNTILLDENMISKNWDFNLIRIIEINQNQ